MIRLMDKVFNWMGYVPEYELTLLRIENRSYQTHCKRLADKIQIYRHTQARIRSVLADTEKMDTP